MLKDATRGDILKSISRYREGLGKSDNLLIYYAGHGHFDKEANRGYWLPQDATATNDPTNRVSNDDISSTLRAMKAKHVLVVADSCYSGTLTRGVAIQEKSPGYYAKLSSKTARVAITSGGVQLVDDGQQHSVFAQYFLKILNENNDIMSGMSLGEEIRKLVSGKATQMPEYGRIPLAGHEGGDFLFIPR